MAIKTLLVEDNPSDARLIREFLSQATCCQVVLSHTDRLSAALECLETEQPDALIIDLKLPDSSGIATFRSVHAKAGAVPVIILTGVDDIEIALATIAEGAADYLLKNDLSASLLMRVLRYSIERKRHESALSNALRSAEILLQELHHRVKNNLQIIASMLNMQADGLPQETQRALDESQRRVRSMALVHEQLYNRERPDRLDFDDYVANLANDLFAAYSVPGTIQLRLDLEPVQLDIDQAIPCGLILNELLTNSLKYAFPDGRAGEIAVNLGADRKGRVTLRIADNGVGFPPGLDWRRVDSLGLRIVDILTAQLNGTVECAAAGGVDFKLRFAREHLGTD